MKHSGVFICIDVISHKPGVMCLFYTEIHSRVGD